MKNLFLLFAIMTSLSSFGQETVVADSTLEPGYDPYQRAFAWYLKSLPEKQRKLWVNGTYTEEERNDFLFKIDTLQQDIKLPDKPTGYNNEMKNEYHGQLYEDAKKYAPDRIMDFRRIITNDNWTSVIREMIDLYNTKQVEVSDH